MFVQRRNRHRPAALWAGPYTRPGGFGTAALLPPAGPVVLAAQVPLGLSETLSQPARHPSAISGPISLNEQHGLHLAHSVLGQPYGAATGHAMLAPSPPGSCKCRFCGLTLSTPSNRHRHERGQHAFELDSQGSMALGSRRPHVGPIAFGVAQGSAPLTLEAVEEAAAAATAAAAPAGAPAVEHADGSELGHGSSSEDADPLSSSSQRTPSLPSLPSGPSSPTESSHADDVRMDISEGEHANEAQCMPCADNRHELDATSAAAAAAQEEGAIAAPGVPEAAGEPVDGVSGPALVAGVVSGSAADLESDCSHPIANLQQAKLAEQQDEQDEQAEQHTGLGRSSDVQEGAQSLSDEPGGGDAPDGRGQLQEEALQSACYPFLQWLASPPLTQTESLVKARRVASLSQLQPIKSNLRFIFALLYECKEIAEVQLIALTRLPTCQALYAAIVERQVGSGRIHAIFLLVKKVVVYLSSAESTKSRQFVQPTIYESYMYVEGICSDSSQQRKQEARNRMVLGFAGGRGALAAAPRASFQIPTTWSSSTESSAGQASGGGHSAGPATAAAAAALPAGGQPASGQPGTANNAPFSKAELQAVTKACLSHLEDMGRVLRSGAPNDLQVAVANRAEWDREFTHHLVTATMCLGLAPRSQVLKQLRLGSSFAKEDDGRYWVRLRAEECKNGKPTRFALASELTLAYDAYLELVRPRMLGGNAAAHDYVFMKRNGAAPRGDFSSSTCPVTQRILGRPINAHAFRAAVITTYYDAGATQAQMDMLASFMAHDPATARDFYYKPQHAQAAVQASQRMAEQLLESGANPADSSTRIMSGAHAAAPRQPLDGGPTR